MTTKRRSPQLAPSARKPADDRRARFISEYLQDFNATRAYIAAGFSPNGARQAASRLLADVDVRAEVDRRIAEAEARLTKRYEVTADRITAEMARLGFSNMADYVTFDAKGNPQLNVAGLTRDCSAAIHSIDLEKGKLRLHDKRASLESLAKMIGMYRDGPDITVPVTFVVERTGISAKRGERT